MLFNTEEIVKTCNRYLYLYKNYKKISKPIYLGQV